jgi:ParB-like chromosome segregation protein Spo0J
MTALQLVPIDSVSPYVRNAKTHSGKQIALIAESIDSFGLVGGIVIRDGVIAKGHGTLSAIKLLIAKGKEIYPPPGREGGAQPYPAGQIPVIDASGWTMSQFRAYLLADNRLAEKSGWDRDLLRIELAELNVEEFDIELTGFTLRDLDALEPDQPGGDGMKYKLIIDCESEEAQRAMMETFEAQGFSVRPLTE